MEDRRIPGRNRKVGIFPANVPESVSFRKMMKPILLTCLLVLSALTAFGQTSDAKKFKDDSEVPRISIEDAKTAYDKKDSVFVDARSTDIYKQEHITGAINIPLGTDNEFGSLPKGKRIIVYCS